MPNMELQCTTDGPVIIPTDEWTDYSHDKSLLVVLNRVTVHDNDHCSSGESKRVYRTARAKNSPSHNHQYNIARLPSESRLGWVGGWMGGCVWGGGGGGGDNHLFLAVTEPSHSLYSSMTCKAKFWAQPENNLKNAHI